MEMTKTEQLLREAHEICQRVTDRKEVSDDLLCSVFRRLEFEHDPDMEEAEEVLHGWTH
jgi:hypothetical protein